MKNWQRRGFGVLAIGGGAIGLGSLMTAVLQGRMPAASHGFVMVLAAAFFGWGIWCGVQLLEGGRRALARNALFWIAQVPLLQTPFLDYGAFCGAQLQLIFKLAPGELGILGSVLGAQFGLGLGQAGARIAIGINLVALCVAFFLVRAWAAAGARALSRPGEERGAAKSAPT